MSFIYRWTEDRADYSVFSCEYVFTHTDLWQELMSYHWSLHVEGANLWDVQMVRYPKLGGDHQKNLLEGKKIPLDPLQLGWEIEFDSDAEYLDYVSKIKAIFAKYPETAKEIKDYCAANNTVWTESFIKTEGMTGPSEGIVSIFK